MKKRTAEEVDRLLKGYEESGLSRQEYCQREGIRLTAFDYYRHRSRQKLAAQQGTAARALVKVRLEPAQSEVQSVFSLTLANGRRIESAWNFRDGDLARLIRIAEAV